MARSSDDGTPALRALRAAKVACTVHPYVHRDDETHFGEEAVAALGADPARVFKTLVVDGGRKLAVAVVPVAGRLDLKAMGEALGVKKIAMADPAAATRATGYVLGGISPLGQRTRLPTVVDATALAYPTVFVSAGRRGLQVELAPADLIRLVGATVHPIAG